MFLLYNFLLTLLAPLWVPWMVWRTWRRKEAVDWQERQGSYELPSRTERGRIWVHAVSVGEVLASLPILREIRDVLPNHEIVLSVTTSSGHQTAREQAEGLFDYLVYFPIDVPRFQLRAMQRIRPDVVAIMETELWLNFLWAAKTFSARTMLINGRISDRSFPRSMKIRFFYRALLKDVDRCLMQSQIDANRIRELGAANPEVIGNCKFDQAMEGIDADVDQWRSAFSIDKDRLVVVVGSIRAEEFSFLAQAISMCPTALWIVAPRHLERTPELAQALDEVGIHAPGYRSQKTSGPVILLDTYGELASVYALADVAVVGGGFANLGGQNIIQPLAHGKPTLYGPFMQNFRDIADMAKQSGSGVSCDTPVNLANEVIRLLTDPPERQLMGAAAKELVRQNIGASHRYAEAIKAEVGKASTRR